jgi:hypothetical protein
MIIHLMSMLCDETVVKDHFISHIELAICNFIAFRIHFCIFDGFRNAFTNYFFAFFKLGNGTSSVYRSYTISLPVNPAKSRVI